MHVEVRILLVDRALARARRACHVIGTVAVPRMRTGVARENGVSYACACQYSASGMIELGRIS